MEIVTITVRLSGHHHNFSESRLRLYYIDAAIWAVKNCDSYKRFKILEIPGEKENFTDTAEYEFTDERDVVLFRLMWT